MTKSGYLRIWLLGTAGACALIGSSFATNFDVPGGSLEAALNAYAVQSGVQLMIPADSIGGIHSRGAKGDLSAPDALSRILSGTGFTARRDSSGVIGIVPEAHSRVDVTPIQMAQAAPARASVETVTVTSSKLGGADVQSIPIAITALSQEQLTATQTAGGPDLVKQVPNLTFTKTNFTGYSIQIRGIGTQAISVTTDPAVAVALNDQPFIRNHFFEQEFYDLAQVEVLRGPQGTLYGRNATAGVVNLTTAKPSDQFEAMASGELGNYHQRRFEGMINIPIVDDWLDIRIAGEWTKRQGYSFNSLTDRRIDGRDLWSGRMTIAWKPFQNLQTYLMWEHFYENDDRLRSSKQTCKTAEPPALVEGVPIPVGSTQGYGSLNSGYFSQGCSPASLYSPEAYQVPYGFSLPYFQAVGVADALSDVNFNPYANTVQSRNLRVIESSLDPQYKAKNDIVELNIDYTVTPSLTFTSQTAFNHDFLWGTQDYNRFNTTPGLFVDHKDYFGRTNVINDGIFCDPQLGCTNRLVAQDLSSEHSWQISQEFRLASNFSGPLNFSFGGNFLHYETEENYYVFLNTLTLFALMSGSASSGSLPPTPYIPGVFDNSNCLTHGDNEGNIPGFQYPNPLAPATPTQTCIYIDPNPLSKLNDEGHNYFLSKNPYVLNSYAGFGEVYYNVFSDLKLTGGLRWTEDRKHFPLIPSQLGTRGYGYPQTGVVDQQWDQLTGRMAANWTPKLDFTEQTLIYGSYAHGYKAGGANPPGAVMYAYPNPDPRIINPVHPLTFKPEFVDAFELGTKNTLLDGVLTLNASAFYYNYQNYQISEIVDRTSINFNFDAHAKGAEVEATWEPLPGLRFNFAGGWEDTALAKGTKAVDLMDRADSANHPDWMVMKPFVTNASNCIFPKEIVADMVKLQAGTLYGGDAGAGIQLFVINACANTYILGLDPITQLPYVKDPTVAAVNAGNALTVVVPGYAGFDPSSVPNQGQGFDKDLSGHRLPNAPPFTVSAGAQYTIPVSPDWAGTLRADYYWQDYSWARVFNDNPYDRLRGYTNVNLTLILTSQNGWQVMLYDKNVFNTTAITGAFLNSDDSGLTTNVFLTDPKLIGIRVTKNW